MPNILYESEYPAILPKIKKTRSDRTVVLQANVENSTDEKNKFNDK